MKYSVYLAFAFLLGIASVGCTSSEAGDTADNSSDTAGENGTDNSGATDTSEEDPCPSGVFDDCGVCDGNNSTCAGCDGVANSGLVDDECGVCGGDNSTCAGCDGEPNSGLIEDACGVCDGDGSTCPPLTDASVLIGRPFLVNLTDATWVQPAGIDSLVGGQLETLGIVMMALEESDLANGVMHAAVLSTELTPAEEGAEEGTEPAMTQDLCIPTPIVTAGDDQAIGTEDDVIGVWQDPRIDIGPTNLNVYAQGQAVTATGVTMRGVFSEDGLSLTNGRLEGKIDLRSAADGLGMAPDQICQFGVTMGIVCEECGEPTPGPYCVGAIIDDVTSSALTNFQPQLRTCAEIIADENCAENIPSICTVTE